MQDRSLGNSAYCEPFLLYAFWKEQVINNLVYIRLEAYRYTKVLRVMSQIGLVNPGP